MPPNRLARASILAEFELAEFPLAELELELALTELLLATFEFTLGGLVVKLAVKELTEFKFPRLELPELVTPVFPEFEFPVLSAGSIKGLGLCG